MITFDKCTEIEHDGREVLTCCRCHRRALIPLRGAGLCIYCAFGIGVDGCEPKSKRKKHPFVIGGYYKLCPVCRRNLCRTTSVKCKCCRKDSGWMRPQKVSMNRAIMSVVVS